MAAVVNNISYMLLVLILCSASLAVFFFYHIFNLNSKLLPWRLYLLGNSLVGKTENINNFYNVHTFLRATIARRCVSIRDITLFSLGVGDPGSALWCLHAGHTKVDFRPPNPRATILRQWARGGECSDLGLSPTNRCKESNVSLFQRPNLRS